MKRDSMQYRGRGRMPLAQENMPGLWPKTLYNMPEAPGQQGRYAWGRTGAGLILLGGRRQRYLKHKLT